MTMISRAEQDWPVEVTHDLTSTLSEIRDTLECGIEVEPCHDCETANRKIQEAIELLHRACTPPVDDTYKTKNVFAYKHGWMKGNVEMALLYLGETAEKSFHHGTTITDLEKTVELAERGE